MKINKKIVVSCMVILGSVIYCVVHFMTYKMPEITLRPLPEFPAPVAEVASANSVVFVEKVSTNDSTEIAIAGEKVTVKTETNNTLVLSFENFKLGSK